MTRLQILLVGLAFEGSLLLLAWGLGWAVGVPPFRGLRLTWGGAGWGLLATLPLLAGLAWITRTAWPGVAVLKKEIGEIVDRLFANCTLIDLMIISALAGICEETFFRGVMQTALGERIGVLLAIGVTSLLFGLAHYVSFTYAAMAAVVGIYLGALLVVFDNLLVPVVAHAAYDFLALTYLVRKCPTTVRMSVRP